MFEIHARELRATFLRNHSVRHHNVRRHKGISKAAQRKAPHRHHTGPHAEDDSSPQNAQATSRGIMPRRHDRKRPQRPPNPGWADVRSSRPAHRRADTAKHAEPNAPVGAKAARSGRVWSPGHTGPACPTTLRPPAPRPHSGAAWINPHRACATAQPATTRPEPPLLATGTAALIGAPRSDETRAPVS